MTERLFGAVLLIGALSVPAAAQDDVWLRRAEALHRGGAVIDGHIDLPWEIREKVGGDLDRMDPRNPLPEQHTDIPRLRQGGVGGVFWAAYVPATEAEPARVALEQIDLIRRLIDRSPDLEFATSASQLEQARKRGKVASLIGIEGGHTIQNSLGALRQFHALGVRYLTLTHGTTIAWADAATDSARHGGLSRFGEEVVREMNRLGMMVDLSHVSPETMQDALRVSQAPVIWSHSSARALADHPRNVPDDVLRMLPGNGGVVMVNFFSGFVTREGAEITRDMFEVRRRFQREHGADTTAAQRAYEAWRVANPIPRGTVATVADHIDHIRRVAGIDHVGLGSDFDGVTSLPEGLDDVAHYPRLTAELLRRGYSEADVRKVLGGNILRVMRQAEQVAARLQRERGPSVATIETLDSPAGR